MNIKHLKFNLILQVLKHEKEALKIDLILKKGFKKLRVYFYKVIMNV